MKTKKKKQSPDYSKYGWRMLGMALFYQLIGVALWLSTGNGQVLNTVGTTLFITGGLMGGGAMILGVYYALTGWRRQANRPRIKQTDDDAYKEALIRMGDNELAPTEQGAMDSEIVHENLQGKG
ncbi:MAG: hypothetical protein AAFR81_21440 [Chloroflexota bacterium]